MTGDAQDPLPGPQAPSPETCPAPCDGSAQFAETNRPQVTPPDNGTTQHSTLSGQQPAAGRANPGTSLGPYELLEETACGGMGIVYRARHTTLGRVVALKTVRGELGSTPGAFRRFAREAQAAARLRHPHIVPIYEVSEHDGRPYFTMPFLSGGSLGKQRTQLAADPRAVARLLEKVARAVHHAHEAGILHRDLKPSNILLDEHGEPLVGDFGLAKLTDLAEELTQTGEMLGTPAYMAPEQAAGRNDQVGRATDIWALGVLLFELTTGRRPFSGEGREALLSAIRTTEPPSPRTLCPQVDRGLEKIILKCLEKEPADRYASAEVLADDLARWTRGELPLARLAGWPRRLARALRRHPGWCAVALACLLALAALAAVQHFTDPERPLRALEARLARGEKVVLVSDTGEPAWFRVPAWNDPIKVFAPPKLPLSVGSLGIGVVELLTDPQSSAYRYRAQVRHDEDNVLGEAGLVIGYSQQPTPLGVEHCFCQLTFADCGPNSVRVYGEGDSPPQRPRHSAVSLSVRRYRDGGPNNTVPLGIYKPFLPTPLTAGNSPPWHDLAVTVLPSGIEAFWDGKSLGSVSWKHVNEEARKLKWAGPGITDDNPRLQPALSPRQGLGLYIQRGAASFRRLTVEPLR